MFRRPRLPPHAPPGGVLVGGAARDLLRGSARQSQLPHDWDWAVPDPQAAAEALAREQGGAVFALDRERGYWRVQLREVWHDFVPLPPVLEDDLRRRDYTVNALALHPGGRVSDPTGGQADLRRRQLRMVSRENLSADPLRLLRGVRLAVTLDLRLEAGTAAAIRELAGAGLPLPAGERVRDELQRLLLHPQAARGMTLLRDLSLLPLYLPELAEGAGVGQGGYHHLDVLDHGTEALRALIASFPAADLTLRWATLLHDVGKPRSRAVDETGRTHFYGHDRLGTLLARTRLAALHESSEVHERVAALIAAHMLPLPATEREARRFVHRRRALLPDLLRLMLADREAARGPLSSPASRLHYQQGLDRVLAALEDTPAPPAPLLSGDDVMTLLGLPPGPAVGAALRALAEARALGDVATPQEARDWLRRWKLRQGL